jgi:circadian clock protein KaiC
MQNKTKKGAVEKLATGISGFDEVLEGGVPKGRSTLITGAAGTGKTVILNEFLYRGIIQFKENGVYVTFEEDKKDIIKNVKNFGWNYNSLIAQKKLAFVDAGALKGVIFESGTNYDLSPLIERVRYALKKVKAKRLVMDSIDSLFSRFQNKDAIRQALYQIVAELKDLGVTALLSGEKVGEEKGLTRYGVEEFVADGAIEIELIKGQQQFLRRMFVVKFRGIGFRSGIVEFEITDQGLVVYPKIPIERIVPKTDFKIRKAFGIKGLDEILGGGIPQGHMVLISGNTGTGKTMFGMQFLTQGMSEGENAVFLALEESVEQVKKTALVHGWDFNRYEKEGKISFVSTSLIDIANDKLLYQIVSAVECINAKRVVVDSISTLMSATMNQEQVRQFLVQLVGYFKRKGVTCVMNYLSPVSFGAVRGQLLSSLMTNEIRLSSITDGIIMLLFVERDQKIKKLLSVLKMRGSQHATEIFSFEIEKGGIKMGEKYKE